MVTGSFSFIVSVALSDSFATLTAPNCRSTPAKPSSVIAPSEVLKLDASSPANVMAPVPSATKSPVPKSTSTPPVAADAWI